MPFFAGEVDIREHDGRFGFGQFCQGIFATIMLADELEAGGAADPVRKDFTGGRIIFDDGDGNAHIGFHCTLIYTKKTVVSFNDIGPAFWMYSNL